MPERIVEETEEHKEQKIEWQSVQHHSNSMPATVSCKGSDASTASDGGKMIVSKAFQMRLIGSPAPAVARKNHPRKYEIHWSWTNRAVVACDQAVIHQVGSFDRRLSHFDDIEVEGLSCATSGSFALG
jgi:hypothetical protein